MTSHLLPTANQGLQTWSCSGASGGPPPPLRFSGHPSGRAAVRRFPRGKGIFLPASGAGESLVQAAPAPLAAGLTSIASPRDMISTNPADGASLKDSPTSLVITFQQEVDFLWLDGDIQLVRVDDQGAAFPIFNPDFVPPATFDASGTQATIPLDQPLAAGHYRILLMGGDGFSDFLSGGTWDASVDQTLADFTVTQPGATLLDATDLGTIGPQIAERSRLPRPLGGPG